MTVAEPRRPVLVAVTVPVAEPEFPEAPELPEWATGLDDDELAAGPVRPVLVALT